MAKSNSIASSIIYKSLERYSSMAFQMVVQIVIARILTPDDYGTVAMMAVFINIAGIFVNNGFNMAVIQKKEANDDDFSTAQIINFLIGLVLYCLILLCAPVIANFYDNQELIPSLTILGLMLPLSSIFSIQSGIASRNMLFKDLFICNVSGSVFSGVVGVCMALMGAGYWALIGQQLSQVIVATCLLLIRTSWKPHFVFVKKSASEMFSFGWKLLVAGLINQIYNELNSLIIGKRYSASDLAFYTKGKTFPTTISSGVDSALQSVMLSAFSKKQSDIEALNTLMRKTVVINTYVITPIMLILAISAKPLTLLLLTEKWLPMVPYMQICCFTFALHPIGSVNMQALSAVGRSDVRLKLEIIKKSVGILLLIMLISYGPLAIAISSAVTSLFSLIIGFIACQLCINYSALKLVKNISPTWLLSLMAGSISYPIVQLDLHPFVIILLQSTSVISIYMGLSILLKIEGFKLLHNQLRILIKHGK